MNLETDYLGLKLANPIMPGASPLVDSLPLVRELEDAGAPAIVMHSLFEEQIVRDQWAAHQHQAASEGITPEASGFFPDQEDFVLGPEEYLLTIQKLKNAVDIPVIASLNGSTIGGWVEYARQIEQAGADALELNTYHVSTDPTESGADVENRTLEILRSVREALEIPIAVKLSPYFSSLPHLAAEIESLGPARAPYALGRRPRCPCSHRRAHPPRACTPCASDPGCAASSAGSRAGRASRRASARRSRRWSGGR